MLPQLPVKLPGLGLAAIAALGTVAAAAVLGQLQTADCWDPAAAAELLARLLGVPANSDK